MEKSDWEYKYEVWADHDEIHLIPKAETKAHLDHKDCWCQPELRAVKNMEHDGRALVHKKMKDILI